MHAQLVVALADAHDERVFGGKAVALGAAIRAGLPVPGGAAVSAAMVDRAAAAEADALTTLAASPHVPQGRLAIRSSAVGEDSAGASFAGQHLTRLNVARHALHQAVCDVWRSARSPSALAYRTRRAVAGEPRIGVVVQRLVDPVTAGVMFTRNPLTGADECLVEAAWGLGEAVVSGTVVPDRVRLDRRGRVLEMVPGDKDVQVVYGEDGTETRAVDAARRTIPCLTAEHLAALHDIADRCRAIWGPALDIEWAIDRDGRVQLLQCRPITSPVPDSGL
jgi:pyruvate,water dikinase